MKRWTMLGACAVAVTGSMACGGGGPAAVAPGRGAVSSEPVATAVVATPGTGAPVAEQAPSARKKLAKVRFDADGEDVGVPLVDVVVGGQPTSLMVDTGATQHVIASWVAKQIGPTSPSMTTGVDHVGKNVTLTRLEGVDIQVSGWGPLGATGALVASLPPILQKQGIGGVLSPISLVKEGRAVVLDLRRGTLAEQAFEDASKALEAEAGVAVAGEVRDCGNGGALSFVKATISGVSVEAQLDTGATSTTVRAGAEVGVKLLPLATAQSSAYAASGIFTVPTVESAHVQIGGLDVATSIDLVKREPRTPCTNDGHIGMDLLRRCTIVLGTKAFSAKCDGPR